MEDFKTIIMDFAEKGSSFEELETEMVRLMGQNPEASTSLLKVLDSAKEEGIIVDQQYNHLLAQLVAADTIIVTDTGVSEEDEQHTQDPKQFFLGDGDGTGEQKVETVGPGTIIKERFELLDVLGVGGMGMVYKARDLIKVEARDRNPFLAIKVLNENFKKHPESFISLQRECSRTQKLAHPNIATVYDFDRFGSMVYMTMQLLDGKPLNDFIKEDVPQKGLSFDEAFPMIEDMGNALTYAHSQHIVHSDFKPGNSFVTKDHGVQVLDFGIARAVKRPGQNDTTLFDAGKLGALTPAYASCEMLEEEEPDPRDDIYALAVVSYIMLSGEHPFDKFPATLARDHGMVAKSIRKLSRAQNRALQRGLSFYRNECTPTAREFVEELKGDGSSSNKFLIATVIGIVVAGLLAIYPVKDYLQEQREAEVASQLASTDAGLVRQTLSTLKSRDDISLEKVLSSARDALLAYYSQQIEDALTGDKAGPNNFKLAEQLLGEAKQWYPESMQVMQLAKRIQQHEARIIDAIDDAFNKIVDQNDVYAAGDGQHVPQLLSLLKQIDAKHSLGQDPRIALIYAGMVDQALQDKRVLEADNLLKEAGAFFGMDPDIKLLQIEMIRRSDSAYVEPKVQSKQDEKAFLERQKKRQERLDKANINARKRSVSIKATSGRPSKAIEHLRMLEKLLPADSPFLTETGPGKISSSYLKIAEPLAADGQYDRAVEMIEKGLAVDPDNEKLKAVLEKYQSATGL